MSQWCHLLQSRGLGHWGIDCVWLYCADVLSTPLPVPSLRCLSSPAGTPPRSFCLLPVFHSCPLNLFFHVSFFYLFPIMFFVLIHIMNHSFYIFYSFIYILHWPFAPLPIPVSVWVLCQPLCQDRSPATPASGGTERETGRAHCHCCTGVVLQQMMPNYWSRSCL